MSGKRRRAWLFLAVSLVALPLSVFGAAHFGAGSWVGLLCGLAAILNVIDVVRYVDNLWIDYRIERDMRAMRERAREAKSGGAR